MRWGIEMQGCQNVFELKRLSTYNPYEYMLLYMNLIVTTKQKIYNRSTHTKESNPNITLNIVSKSQRKREQKEQK